MPYKEIVKQEMGFDEAKKLTIKNIARELLVIFKDHIGQEKEIDRTLLYRELFGRKYRKTLADELRWDYTRMAMNMLRKRSNCFIGQRIVDDKYTYFVLKNNNDLERYEKVIKNAIKKMLILKKRAKVSVTERWYQQEWILPGRKIKVIGNGKQH